MRVLLHACCGPCLLEPFDALVRDHDVEIAFANPNIHPAKEYERRRDTLRGYAAAAGIPVREIAYDPASWAEAVAGVEEDPASRCRRCFALRLRMTAESAAVEGFDAIATTLTVSPYQDLEAIRDAGEAVARDAELVYVHHDFTARYPEATRRSREIGMYRQNYCGCVYSYAEARACPARLGMRYPVAPRGALTCRRTDTG